MRMENEKRLLPLGAMARRLHVTTKWLRGEAEAGRLPHLKAGDRFLFVGDAVEKILYERAKLAEATA